MRYVLVDANRRYCYRYEIPKRLSSIFWGKRECYERQEKMSFVLSRLFLAFFLIGILTNCSTYKERSQQDTKLLIEYALYDFPFPSSADIIEKETVILGSGERWSGKVVYNDRKSPAELLKYYGQSGRASGWAMKASTVSKGIFLVFSKDHRVATVEINRLSFLEGIKVLAPRTTSVTISVNWEDTIGKSREEKNLLPNDLNKLQNNNKR